MGTVGVVGVGSMGSALAAGWVDGGHRVVVCVAGRSERTRALAASAGVDVVDTLAELVAVADVVASVVPPAAATAVGTDLAEAARVGRAHPLVVDLNAVSPGTVREVASCLAQGGCDLVDASISGGPPGAGDTTRVYLSGARAADVLALTNPRIDAVVLGPEVGTASALKMCTASMYKGTKALVMHALVTAEAHGVTDAFLADTARAWPDDVPRWPRDVAVASSKAWRFVDEMHEVAATQREAGLPAALFEGVAAAYLQASRSALGATRPEDVPGDVDAAAVVRSLRRPPS
ncbi:MAG TPA: NAD(P)-binding domain-containing protein [Actinomycetales bacterium]|nr:NAD(P)-binding domain-containing protein [Actinomycetales bacterium]